MSYMFGKFGISNLGNTSGTSGTVNRGIVFAGGNNVTLSQSVNASSATVTISAANQTIQTQNLHNVTLSGNTAGVMAQVSSGTLTLAGGNNITLSQNGNAVTIAGAAGGGGGGIALANSQTTYTSGTANLAVAGGALTIASTTGQSFNFSVPQTSSLSATGIVSIATNASTISIGAPAFSAGMSNIGNTSGTSGVASNQLVLAGGSNITLSQSTGAGGNTITISAGAAGGGDIQLSHYQNMDRGTTTVLAIPYNTLFLQRLNQENDLFAGNITANTMLFNMSGSVSTGASSTQTLAARTLSLTVGIYQPVSSANTVLTLINSASFTHGTNNTGSVYPLYHGNRWLSIHSSQWSSAPSFTQGGDYVFAMLARSSGTSTALSFIGQNYMNSNQRSGQFGVSTTTGHTSMPHGNFWNAVYSVSASALPGAISADQVNRNNATAIFIPHIILNNQYTY